jgi:hypothetical protein
MDLTTKRSLQLDLDYDEEGDVLYASIGAPQPAAGIEVAPDVVLRYIPLSCEVVGLTTLNFLEHFPLPSQTSLPEHMLAVATRLLQQYSKVAL